MTLERAIELMSIEQQCVERSNMCDRNCFVCELVQDDAELIEAYKIARQCIMLTITNKKP